MKKEITILFIPFTGLGKPNYRGDEWFKNRIELFHKFTLKSLLNQRDKNFVIWCQFRPEERDNPLVKTIKIPLPHIFTFGGIAFWDDKYAETENEGLLKRLNNILPELKELVGRKNVKLVNLASDDMYAKDVIENINKEEFKEGTALTHRQGYIYSYTQDRLAYWKPTTHPPFHTIMMKNETFLNPSKHFEFIRLVKSHEFVPIVFKEKEMGGSKYCVVVHDHNISTTFEHLFAQGEIFYEEPKSIILEQFGIKKKTGKEYNFNNLSEEV